MSIASKYRDTMRGVADQEKKCFKVQPNGSFTFDNACMKRVVSPTTVGNAMRANWTQADRDAVSAVLKGGA